MPHFILDWFDEVLGGMPHSLMRDDLKELLDVEIARAMATFKAVIYGFKSEDKAHFFARNNHCAIVLLIDKAYTVISDNLDAKLIWLAGTNYLLEWYEREFSRFLSGAERVTVEKCEKLLPIIRLAQKEVLLFGKEDEADKSVLKLVNEVLEVEKQRLSDNLGMNRSHWEYLLNLCNELQYIRRRKQLYPQLLPVHELILSWNINTPTILKYFQNFFIEKQVLSPSNDTIVVLKSVLSIISQCDNIYAYNPNLPGLADSLRVYLEAYCNISTAIETKEPEEKVGNAPMPIRNTQKVLIVLSTDQFGLLLSAAQDLGYLKARSKRALFKSIIPYISTPNTPNPSWDAVRSASYATETNDQEHIIEVLQKIQEWIREH